MYIIFYRILFLPKDSEFISLLFSLLVDGGFTDWSEWTSCSQTCGTGSQIRFRTCSNPIPQHGGMDCDGTMTEVQSCKLSDCPSLSSFSFPVFLRKHIFEIPPFSFSNHSPTLTLLLDQTVN